MRFIPYLDFDGNCKEAFDFYARVFKGRIVMQTTYGESPMAKGMSPETHARIMHTQLDSAGAVLMGADGPPEPAVGKGCVNIDVDSTAEAERIFDALADGARVVQMPLQETFWAQRFGMLIDRYGKAWMVNCMKS